VAIWSAPVAEPQQSKTAGRAGRTQPPDTDQENTARTSSSCRPDRGRVAPPPKVAKGKSGSGEPAAATEGRGGARRAASPSARPPRFGGWRPAHPMIAGPMRAVSAASTASTRFPADPGGEGACATQLGDQEWVNRSRTWSPRRAGARRQQRTDLVGRRGAFVQHHGASRPGRPTGPFGTSARLRVKAGPARRYMASTAERVQENPGIAGPRDPINVRRCRRKPTQVSRTAGRREKSPGGAVGAPMQRRERPSFPTPPGPGDPRRIENGPVSAGGSSQTGPTAAVAASPSP